MIISVESLRLVVWATFFRLGLQYPRNHYVLFVAFVPTSAAGLLFQSPDIQQDSASGRVTRGRLQCAENLADSLNSSFRCGQMVYDSN